MSPYNASTIVGAFGVLSIWAACSFVTHAAMVQKNATLMLDEHCKKTTTCEVLKYNTCLGSPLPYTHTSLILAEDSNTQEEAFEKLAMWSGMTFILDKFDELHVLESFRIQLRECY